MRLLLQNGYYSEIPVPLLFTNATDSFTVFTFPALHYHSTSFIKCFCHLSCSTSKFPWLVLMPVSATGRYRSWKQGPGDPLGFPPCFLMGFPGGSGDGDFAYNAGDLGSILGLGRSPGEYLLWCFASSEYIFGKCMKEQINYRMKGWMNQWKEMDSQLIHE